jgi:AcrR family transcriptional regulator
MKNCKLKKIAAKENILDAAITVFARNGFDAARTRDIAALAKTNICMLHYHFVSKDNIYKSVIDRIKQEAQQHMLVIIAEQQKIIENAKNKKQIIEAIKAISLTFVEVIISPEKKRFAKIVAFEQLEQSKHFKTLFNNVMKPVCDPMMLAVSKILDQKITATEVILNTHTLMGILCSFEHSKSSLMYVSGWKEYNSKNIGHIKNHISNIIDTLFLGYL